MNKGKVSFLVLVLMIVTAFVLTFIERKWEKEDVVINHDVVSYYSYLPAAFVYDDLTLEFVSHRKEGQNFLIWPETLENGTRIIKTTMGVSYFYAPFFFVAHASAESLGYLADGFSLPYRMALMLCLTFYFSLSLVVLRSFLLRYFNDLVVAITLFGIVAGTNYLHYGIYDIPMSHTFSFFLFALFLLLTDNWYKKQSFLSSLLLGLTAGTIALVRPVDVLFMMVFIFWGVTSFSSLKSHFLFFISKIKYIIIIIVSAFISALPQLIYWKVITGNWVVYSYGDEGFFFDSPHIFDGMFGFRNGWVLYSPTILFCLIGMYLVRRYCSKLWVPMLIYVPINMYVVLSWWCWWYTGFGNRAFINSYALMSIGLAAFLTWTFDQGKKKKVLFTSLLTVSVGLSIYHTYLFNTASIHHNGMTRTAYLESFKNGHSTGKYWESLRIPDHEKAKVSSETHWLDERNLDFGLYTSLESIDKKNEVILADSGNYELEGVNNLSNVFARSGVYSVSSQNDTSGALSYTFEVYRGEVYKATVYRKCVSEDKSGVLAAGSSRPDVVMPLTTSGSDVGDGWQKLELIYSVSYELEYHDLGFYVYNPDSSEVYFDDFSIERIDGTTIQCDLEKFSDDKRFFENEQGVLFWDVATVDSTLSFSGSKSVKVNKDQPYSLARELLVARGMEIEISVWRNSETKAGSLVLSRADNSQGLASSTTVVDHIGPWEKIQMKYVVPNELDNKYLKVFVYNPELADANFDDIEISFIRIDKSSW